MAVTVQYTPDQRLILSGLSCDCPCTHQEPTQDIYVGRDLIAGLPAAIARRALGTHCVLVADETTYAVAGQQVEETLKAAGFDVIRCVIRRAGEVRPDETSCGEVLLSIQPETEFLISVGSGTITDTTRINATRTGLPFVAVGTAPSMDGYTSVVAPLLLRNVKIHRPGKCPDIILCDLDVLATAPLQMIASGVGDVLGKYIARADWQIGQIINDEAYCPTCGDIVLDAVNKLVNNIEEIRQKTEKGMRILIEALLLSGMTILVIGNTRAVASIEHNIAQFWEMKLLQQGKEPPQHGSSVGVATLLVWPLFTRFLDEDLSKLDLEDIKRRRISRAAREKWMLHAYGEEGGAAIMRENPGDFLDWEEQKRRIERMQDRFAEIQAVIRELPPMEAIADTMRHLDAHMTPEEENVDAELLWLSMRCGKDYRTRYTLFKLLDECGLLEGYLTE
ncbi:MAG: sn-glycerol-1-phosphate dehydrogenase [Oscillospiraceae bacterium]|jgi:glycerol-1-phosphate dehydrogenase [NAD(P)+]|nr:sn-glycerol-1-phosphate dehydrogenase [Oscillospiraceae bacterium]